MANKTIGQLNSKTTPASADVFVLEDTEDTKKINYDALADAILNKITSKNYTVAGSSQTLINAINTLNSKTKLTITPSENVVISSVSHVYVSGNFLYIAVKGRATADISNAQLFSWGGGKNIIANGTCMIGIGSEWNITGAGYGFIAGNSVVSNVQNNTWFHVMLTVLVA